MKTSFKTIMKRLPLMAAILGGGLAIATPPYNPSIGMVLVRNHAESNWYMYNGSGSRTDPNNYTYTSADPGCNGDGSLCAIHCNGGSGSSGKPDATSLTALSSASSNFTTAYSGDAGVVTLHD